MADNNEEPLIKPNNKVLNKKLIIIIIITIVCFLAIVIGATYAFFTVGSVNNFGTKRVSVSLEEMGTVVLNGTSANMTLNISASEMAQQSGDVTYYASTSGTTTTPTEVTVGNATVTGTGKYTCTFTMNVTHTGTNDMYNVFNALTTNKSLGQIILTVNGRDYDWYNGLPTTITDSFTVSNANPVALKAGLRIVNKANVNQSNLANTDISINLSIPNGGLTCETAATYATGYFSGWQSFGTPASTDYQSAAGNNYIMLRAETSSDTPMQTCAIMNNTPVCVTKGTYNTTDLQDQCSTVGGTYTTTTSTYSDATYNTSSACTEVGGTWTRTGTCMVYYNGDEDYDVQSTCENDGGTFDGGGWACNYDNKSESECSAIGGQGNYSDGCLVTKSYKTCRYNLQGIESVVSSIDSFGNIHSDYNYDWNMGDGTTGIKSCWTDEWTSTPSCNVVT